MARHPHDRPGRQGGDDTHRPPEVRHVEWTDTDGTVRLSRGRWTLRATPDALVLRVEAANEDDLQRMQDLIAMRVEKIGRRDRLTVPWQRSEATGIQPGEGDGVGSAQMKARPRQTGSPARRRSLGVVGGVAALLVVGHLVLGGSVLAASQWLGWGAGAVILAVVVVKVIGLGGLAARHGHRYHRHRRKEGI